MLIEKRSSTSLPTIIRNTGFVFPMVRKSKDVAPESSLDLAIAVVRESITRRKQNNRDTVTQCLKAGRVLVEIIKPTVPYGTWEQWLQSHADELGYAALSKNPVRAAQNDMQLWTAWKPHIKELTEANIVYNLDAPEGEFVESLDDDQVSVALSTLQEFMRKDVPDIALRMALDTFRRDPEAVRGKGAQAIIDTAVAIDQLPTEDVRKLALELYSEHGLSNPDVINSLAKLDAETVAEIRASGNIYVPGIEREVPISRASRTDIELAQRGSELEIELTRQQTQLETTKSRNDNRDDTAARFLYLRSFEGSLSDILAELERIEEVSKTDMNTYKINIYIEKA